MAHVFAGTGKPLHVAFVGPLHRQVLSVEKSTRRGYSMQFDAIDTLVKNGVGQKRGLV